MVSRSYALIFILNTTRKTPDKQETLNKHGGQSFNTLGKKLAFRLMHGLQQESPWAAGWHHKWFLMAFFPVNGLLFLGYPLHPAGDKEKLRDTHLYRIKKSMLFFAGTRDPLCNMEKLNKVLSRLQAHHKLLVIEGGDHSFMCQSHPD